MAESITVPIETDPAEIAAIGFDYMEAAIPGWNRARGDPASQIIASCAQMMAPARDTASDMPTALNRYDAVTVDGLLPHNATAAQTTATVTALDADGHTIDDGTAFKIKTSGDTGQIFLSVGTVTIPPLSTSTAAGEVVLVAEVPGAAGSGLPADSVVVPVEALAWVDTVTLTALTTGGVDAETDPEHLARWLETRRLMRMTPVLAEHAAAITLVLIPEVGRALGIDNYDPVLATYGHERTITVFVADATGEAVSTDVKNEIEAMLEAKREWNTVIWVRDPSYATIKVTTAVTTYPGFDPAGVELVVAAALTAYLSPATWGTPFGSDAKRWIDETAVRYLEVAEAINRVEGVHFITALTIAQGAGTLGVIDLPLTGRGVLTRPGVIVVTATSP